MISGVETMATESIERVQSFVDEKIHDGKEMPLIDEIRDSEGELIIERPDIAYIERTNRATLIEQNTIVAREINRRNDESSDSAEIPRNTYLSEEAQAKIKEEAGWSNEIIENIKNAKQYEILKEAGLKEVEINNRKCLIKENIDLAYKDADGITNRDRIVRGLAPLDSQTGKPFELHHLGQKADSPLVELTEKEHRTGITEEGVKNQSVWHDNTKETEVHGEGNNWTEERKAHWKARFQ